MIAEPIQPEVDLPEQYRHLGPKPFSPETLAERWGCSAEKIRQMVHRGELPGFRLGKLIRIKAIEVERYECAQTQPTKDMNSSDIATSSPSRLDEAKIAADTRRALMTLVSRA
jgi:excisionase family DNA binding protein